LPIHDGSTLKGNPAFISACNFLASQENEIKVFKFCIGFQISGKTLKQATPFDKWEVTLEKVRSSHDDFEELNKKVAVFLKSIMTLTHSSNCYQFISSDKIRYQVTYTIGRETDIDFSDSTLLVHTETILGNIKITISEICLTEFSEAALNKLKIKEIGIKEESAAGLSIGSRTHLQAIKTTVTPFRNVGLRKSSRITEEDEEFFGNREPKTPQIKVDLNYFNEGKEEDISKILEDDVKEYSIDEFCKKIKKIKHRMKMEEQYMPSLDNIEATFYELIESGEDIKKELEAYERKEGKR